MELEKFPQSGVTTSIDGDTVVASELTPLVGSVIAADTGTLLGGRFAPDLRALLEARSVLVFPQIGFDDEQQIAFTQTLGTQAFENNGVAQANGARQPVFNFRLDPAAN